MPRFESQPATIQTVGTFDGGTLRLTMTSDSGANSGVARRTSSGTAAPGSASARNLPSFAYGTWTLRNARDERGQVWNNSVLQFRTQSETADGLSLVGRFTWRLDDVLQGTEEVQGQYIARTRQVILEGTSVADAPRSANTPLLAVGSYSAVLSADERSLIEGRWGSTAQNEPGVAGTWEAVR